MIDKLRAGANPIDVDILENWVFDYEATIKLFKMVSRTTIKLDCMAAYEKAKLELREVLKNSCSKVSLTADMWTSNHTLGYLCVTCHFISQNWTIKKLLSSS
jgi:hypothetical protein